jgi:hypothetical protein
MPVTWIMSRRPVIYSLNFSLDRGSLSRTDHEERAR